MCDVTVLMTVFNGQPYLEAAVNSILNQTLQDFRFVIVNDGSTDGTAAYLESLQDPRIVVIKQDHKGTAAAANHGLEYVTTPYVARMDSDDISMPERLQVQLDFMKSNPNVGIVGAQSAPIGNRSVGKSLNLPTTHHSIMRSMMNSQHGIAHCSIMIRTEVLRSVSGYWKYRLIDDWDMMLRVGEVAQLANLEQVLLHYRVHANSLTGICQKRMFLHYGFAIERAKCRQRKIPELSYEQYLNQLQKRSFIVRAADAVHVHAVTQYRLAIAEIYGNRPAIGYMRLFWAALCGPARAAHRLGRIFRLI